jgi:hypothetical protein
VHPPVGHLVRENLVDYVDDVLDTVRAFSSD